VNRHSTGEDHQFARRYLMRISCKVLRTTPPVAITRLLTNSTWSSSCVERWTRAATPSFPSAEWVGTQSRRLPSSRHIFTLVCAPEHSIPDISAIVFVMMQSASTGTDFQQPQQQRLGRNKLSFCNFSFTPAKICRQRLGKHCAWLFDWILLVSSTSQSQIYRVFLEEMLTKLLKEVPFALQVREHPSATFNNSWIGKGGPVGWPPRSLDLTPVDLLVWV
jgi:hypothetical protein